MGGDSDAWWREGVLYEIYPRSFVDANGDGVGDLAGITDRLDYLAWLGVDGIWLNPINVSPNADWGYDVADYCDVDPVLGSLADAERLVDAAAARGLRVLLDLVPNHTSDRHPWFVASRTARDDPHRDYYVWADPKPDGAPPNNWRSTFGGPAWTLDEATGQYYLHNFLAAQPDLNWWNPAVRAEFDEILRFWFDRGVAGFRIDVVHMVVKDRHLRDNPPATDADHPFVQVLGQQPRYTANQPEVHEVIRHWRAIAESYTPARILVGETHVFDPDTLASFYGHGDELNLGFNFMVLHAPLATDVLAPIVEVSDAAITARGGRPVWTGGNHDVSRFATRWADGDPRKTRAALVMLLALHGPTFLYYGDELGLPDTPVPDHRVLDPVGERFPGFGRDPQRCPMPWTVGPGRGFCPPGVEPWLPLGGAGTCVDTQRADPDSTLSLARDLIQLRAAVPDLRAGDYRPVDNLASGVWAWRRGERILVALNLAEQPATIPAVHGLVRICTDRARDNSRVDGALHLAGWDAAISWLDR